MIMKVRLSGFCEWAVTVTGLCGGNGFESGGWERELRVIVPDCMGELQRPSKSASGTRWINPYEDCPGRRGFSAVVLLTAPQSALSTWDNAILYSA